MWTLHCLLQDVVRQHGYLTTRSGDFQATWDALNRYLTETMEKKQTLHVPYFGKIGWRIQDHAQGKVFLRPHFQMDESFIRNHGLEAQTQLPSDWTFTATEEFNYSKAALRFSRNLTKENVFMGLRLLFQHLGQLMSTGEPVEIDFEVGKLHCADRSIGFAFDTELYTREGLTPPASCCKDAAYKPSATFSSAPPHQDTLNFLNISGRTSTAGSVRAHPAILGGWSESNQPTIAGNIPLSSCPSEAAMEDCQESNNEQINEELQSAAEFSGSDQVSKYEVVHGEAWRRHFHGLDQETSTVVAEKEDWEVHLQTCKEEVVQEISQKKQIAKKYAADLLDQIQEVDEQRTEERQFAIMQASQHDFPDIQDNPKDHMYEYVREQKNRLRNELDQQVDLRRQMRRAARQRDKQVDTAHLQQSAQELMRLKMQAESKKDEEYSVLHQAWDQDKRWHRIRRYIQDHHRTPAIKSALGGSSEVTNRGHLTARENNKAGPNHVPVNSVRGQSVKFSEVNSCGSSTATSRSNDLYGPLSPRPACAETRFSTPSCCESISDRCSSGGTRPLTGSLRRLPISAAASLALQRQKMTAAFK